MKKIVGVAACPTGLAHTYVAAESLEKVGKELGYEIKIETQGSGGNVELTADEIRNADVVILACDRYVDLSRFDGKKALKVNTNKASMNPKGVIEDAINGKGVEVIYAEKQENSKAEKDNPYKHLMTGINYMLPFVIVGGILIAASFAFGIHAFDETDPSYNPIAGALFNIGSNGAFGLMIVALGAGIGFSIAEKPGIVVGATIGYLAKSGGSGFIGAIIGAYIGGYFTKLLIDKWNLPKSLSSMKGYVFVPIVATLASGMIMIYVVNTPMAWLLGKVSELLSSLGETSATLLGFILGAMMTFDMGGPLNKAASAFYIGLMAEGIYWPAASCMAAGIVPPLGLALATVLFPKKFTDAKKESGKSCWVMGASYITEGAIPFAAADPKAVFPANMLGGAVASALSALFGCASMAPHGGLFCLLIPNAIQKPLMWLLAIVIGTVVSCLTVSILKKNK